MKRKIYIIFLFLFALTLMSGITYSIFHSNINLNSVDQNVAKFIFNSEYVDEIKLPLIDLKPGDKEEFLFNVSNYDNEKTSDVIIEYNLIIKTYHFLPLNIELYKINEDNEEKILSCDETFSRNEDNYLICNTDDFYLDYNIETMDNYKLIVKFPKEFNSEKYAGLVDFLDVEIKSRQKIVN